MEERSNRRTKREYPYISKSSSNNRRRLRYPYNYPQSWFTSHEEEMDSSRIRSDASNDHVDVSTVHAPTSEYAVEGRHTSPLLPEIIGSTRATQQYGGHTGRAQDGATDVYQGQTSRELSGRGWDDEGNSETRVGYFDWDTTTPNGVEGNR